MPFREDIQKIEEYDKAMDRCSSIFVSLLSNKLGKIVVHISESISTNKEKPKKLDDRMIVITKQKVFSKLPCI